MPLGSGIWIEPGALIGVDEVQADRVLADADLAGAGIADLDVLPDEHFGTAGLVESNRFGHLASPKAKKEGTRG